VILAVLAPDLDVDDVALATRLRPGLSVREVCSGEGEGRVCLTTVVPQLDEGAHLVVIADLADAATGAAVPRLNTYHEAGEGPFLWLLTASPPEVQAAFYFAHGPAFQPMEAPPGLLRPLHRRLPRSFLVRDGRVTDTWSGLPPLEALGR
jgi:hypothetical protein